MLALRTAYRMSKREFASVLGMTHKSIALWENPLGAQSISPTSQAALDTLLRRADPETKARFCVMVAQVGCPCSVGERAGNGSP